MKYLNIKFSPLSAALVLSAAGLLGSSALQAGEQAATAPGDPALATAVTQAIHDALDYKAKDIQVAVNGGVVMLSGWAKQPSDESRARAVASRVPGVVHAYSRVHLWSSDDS